MSIYSFNTELSEVCTCSFMDQQRSKYIPLFLHEYPLMRDICVCESHNPCKQITFESDLRLYS